MAGTWVGGVKRGCSGDATWPSVSPGRGGALVSHSGDRRTVRTLLSGVTPRVRPYSSFAGGVCVGAACHPRLRGVRSTATTAPSHGGTDGRSDDKGGAVGVGRIPPPTTFRNDSTRCRRLCTASPVTGPLLPGDGLRPARDTSKAQRRLRTLRVGRAPLTADSHSSGQDGSGCVDVPVGPPDGTPLRPRPELPSKTGGMMLAACAPEQGVVDEAAVLDTFKG